MAHLGPGESLKKRMRYPHMLQEDHAIWNKFIEAGDYPVEKVWYDVHCGLGIEVDPQAPEWMHRQAMAVGQLRIDVVAQVKSALWLIELKPDADGMAIGQMMCYLYHFSRDFPDLVDPIPVIITDFVNANALPIFDVLGFTVIEVGWTQAILPD